MTAKSKECAVPWCRQPAHYLRRVQGELRDVCLKHSMIFNDLRPLKRNLNQQSGS